MTCESDHKGGKELDAVYRVYPSGPWEGYGSILVTGAITEPFRRDGLLTLERTGPYHPPFSVTSGGFFLVTDEFRGCLEVAFPEIRFRPVIKEKIVELHWEEWDLTSEMPEVMAPEGEPDSYLDSPHSPKASQDMGDLWEIVLDEGIRGDLEDIESSWEKHEFVFRSTWNGLDFMYFKPRVIKIPLISERAKHWLEEMKVPWLEFESVEIR